MADDINLPNLVSALQIDLSGLSGAVGDGARQGTAIGEAIGDGVRERLAAALQALPVVNISADSSQADRDIAALDARINALGEQRIGVDIPIARALTEIDEIQANLSRLADTHPDVQVRADIEGALAELDLVRAAAHRLDTERPTIRPEVDRDSITEIELDLTKLGSKLAGLGKTVGLASFAPQIAGAAASLANLAPAAAVAATGILAAGSAMAAIKLGTAGLSDALQGDKTALDKLAPSARQFVGAIKTISPEFDKVRTAIQQSLFFDLGPTLTTLARTALPSVQSGLGTTAAALNLMGRNAAGAVTQLAKTGTLRGVLEGVGDDLADLGRVPGQVVTGLVQLGAAAEPVFARITGDIASVADDLSTKLSGAFKSGGLAATISDAADLVGQLVTTFENFGIAAGNIFGPALKGGSTFLGTLAQIGQTLASVTGTKAAQQTFTALFGALKAVSGLISGTLSAALQAVMPLISTLVNSLAGPLQSLAATLAPVLAGLVGTLGKALQPVIAALGKGLAVLAPVIGVLVTALASALTPVLGVVGELLADLLPPVAAIIAQVGTALAPILRQVGQVIAQVGTALINLLAPILKILPSLIGPIITPLTTMLSTFAGIASQLLGALQPALTSLGNSLATVLKAASPLISVLAKISGVELAALAKVLPPIIGFVGRLASLFANELASYINKVAVPAIHAITDLLHGNFSGAANYAKQAISGMISFGLNLFASFPGKVVSALGPFGTRLYNTALAAGARLVSAVASKVSSALSTIGGLPGRAVSALGRLGSRLYSAGASLISGFISGIRSQISKVESTLSSLTDSLPDWKGPKKKDATLLTPAGKLLIQGLVAGIDAATPSLKSKLAELTTDIQKAVDLNAGNRHKVSGLSSLLNQVKSDNKQLLSLANERDSVASKLKAANANLAALQADSTKVASNISSGILQDANITTAAGAGDGIVTVAGITQGLQQSVIKAKTFADQIAKLKKEGLSPELLQELADAGVSGGGATAAALAGASQGQIAEINAQQKKLDSAAKSTGSTVANSLYGAGIQAAQGLVKGLQNQQGQIEKQMQKIAESMEKALKKALGIHSPAKRLVPIGEFSGDGVVLGLQNRFAAIRQAAAQAGQLVASAASGAAAALGGVPTAAQLQPLVAGSAPAAYQPTNHFHLYGSDATPGGISRQLAWDAKVGRRS